MKAQSTGPILSAVFVDYDNIYLSLKRRSEEAARRFAKDAGLWLNEIATGRLITPTNGPATHIQRRIVMNRCYGNPVPRRNASDNSTDMNSFPFVRHHFLRAGFEVIDCPPLTAQLKNSADIRMVMDVRDYLLHDTHFDEFIILSGDADFTPVLHRLRAHARHTVVFANDHTAAPYTALSDGEVRESSLIALLMEGRTPIEGDLGTVIPGAPSSAELEATRRDIVAEVVGSVRAAGQPVPLEALADRAVRALGHDKTVGSSWGGAGSFRDLLSKGLPEEVRLSGQPPYFVFDAGRDTQPAPPRRSEPRPDAREPAPERLTSPSYNAPLPPTRSQRPAATAPTQGYAQSAPQAPQARLPIPQPGYDVPLTQGTPQRHLSAPQPAQARPADSATAIQQSVARIYEACQAPPLSPPEYRVLFRVMADEINTNSLAGSQTLINMAQRAREVGVDVQRDDVRFVLEVVSEADPWFEQGASANLFASRFRNFVVARCRSQGLNLSADELDLIEAWFGNAATGQQASLPAAPQRVPMQQNPQYAPTSPAQTQPVQPQATERWWGSSDGEATRATQDRFDPTPSDPDGEEFPRIVRTRLRG
jgi:hypothetical protein